MSPNFKTVCPLMPTPHKVGFACPCPSESRSSTVSNPALCVLFVQRAVQVSATTTGGALWKPAGGTASASQDGEGLAVTFPWKLFVPTARTMKEVGWCDL